MDVRFPVKTRVRTQITKRLFHGGCVLCHERNAATLVAHRVLPGERGGRYDWANVATLCQNCHARLHSGQIRMEGPFQTSDGVRAWRVTDASGTRFVDDAPLEPEVGNETNRV